MNRFKRFIESSYHNKSEKLRKLFKEISKHYPGFTSKNLNKEYLSKKISPSLKYNDSTFRNMIFDMQILLEKFMIIEQVFESGSEKNIFLLKSLVDRGNDVLFRKTLKKTMNQTEESGIDSIYYRTKSHLELYQINNNELNKSVRSTKDIDDNITNLYKYIIYITNDFILEIINSHLTLKVQESKFNIRKKTDFSLGLIESFDINKISQHIKKADKNNFILDLYLQLFLTFQNLENRQSYSNYKSLISKHYKKLSRDELAYHYSMLITYCLIQNSNDRIKSDYDNELFRLYHIFLKEKLFIDKKTQYISEVIYRNILVLSLRLKKYDWTFGFISQYSKYLHPEKHKNMVNFANASYYYNLGSDNNSLVDLNKAFEHLKEIKEESFIYKYDIKILYLMLYYDLGYIDNLLSQLRNYRQFLSRNLLVTERKKERMNKFLNILEKLTFLKEGNTKIDLAKLNTDILKLNNYNYQEWLLKKVQIFNRNTNFKKLKHG
ncbi:MAG TPA: hypothetical protein PKA90_16940 [Ignavibacteria bacterium]|nr:hypothetical protein [Ignavibacteria bacterium]HMR42105.1 hypothetical protein [Ignavibacteria bacterium]